MKPTSWTLLLALAACGDPDVDADADGALGAADCDDHDARVHPGAPETCNAVDDDCDGTVDEDLLLLGYVDADRDKHGDGAHPLDVCAFGPGVVASSDDCDDTDVGVVPGAAERCDGRDQDCDGVVDEGLDTVETWADVDGDGAGDPATATTSCDDVGSGRVTNHDDCDDRVSTVHRGADEICNAVDDDCDGTIDDGVQVDGYVDADGDGWGNPEAQARTCIGTPGFVGRGGDCDDGDPTTSPDGVEVCDGSDDDCDGVADQGVQLHLFRDIDEDGFGDPQAPRGACASTPGFVADDTDCDDLEPASFPGNPEICDGLDNDCDHHPDDGLRIRWYPDIDGDGLGDPWAPVETCDAPDGFVAEAGDCDDHDAAVPPDCGPTLYGDWATFGADPARSGHAFGTVGTGTATFVWQHAGSYLQSQFAAASGRVFTSEMTPTYQRVIVATDLYTGELLWTSRVFGASGVMSGPTQVDGRVCLTLGAYAPDGQVACLDEATGDELWSTLTSTSGYDVIFSPLALDGVLYSGGGSYSGLMGHDLVSGQELFVDEAYGGLSVVGVAAFDDRLYSAAYGVLSAQLPFTGEVDWDLTFDPSAYYTAAPPAISDDGVAVLADYNDVRAIELASRSELWALGSGSVGGAAIGGDDVYFVRADGIGRGHALASGAFLRSFPGDGLLVGPPVVTDDAVIFASLTDTYVYERATGTLLQHIDAGGTPIVADNHLLLADPSTGVLRAYAW